MSKQIIEIGKRIKIRRKELNIKQSQLAERLNISNNHMSAIENGRENPSLDLFSRICEELKVTPDYLFLGTMHTNNIPRDIIDSLRLCSEEDIMLAKQVIDLLVERNKTKWNDNNFI